MRETDASNGGLPMETFLRDLLDHAEWANAVFFHAWGKSPARDHEELRRRVGHILDVQQGFLSIVRGEGPKFPPELPCPHIPVSGDLAATEYLEALADVVPVRGPVMNMSLFSAPRGSAPAGTSS